MIDTAPVIEAVLALIIAMYLQARVRKARGRGDREAAACAGTR